jgi:hypothetical protein
VGGFLTEGATKPQVEIGVLGLELDGLFAFGGGGVPLLEGKANAADKIVGQRGSGRYKGSKQSQGLIRFARLQGRVGLKEGLY